MCVEQQEEDSSTAPLVREGFLLTFNVRCSRKVVGLQRVLTAAAADLKTVAVVLLLESFVAVTRVLV